MHEYRVSPCTECIPPKRCLKCHASCPEYKAWKEEHERIKDKAYLDSLMRYSRFSEIYKTKKLKKMKRGRKN